ncbi:hydrogen cyanide synthase, partial [Pseudomonas aeruginosa]
PWRSISSRCSSGYSALDCRARSKNAGGLWAIGESVGLGCGVIFFRMMSSRNRREAQGAAVAVDASTPHILPPAFFD